MKMFKVLIFKFKKYKNLNKKKKYKPISQISLKSQKIYKTMKIRSV